MVLYVIPISAQKNFSLTSPDGNLVANVDVDKQLSYNIQFQGKEVLSSSPLSITTTQGVIWGNNPQLLGTARKSVNQIIPSPFYRSAELNDNYNQLVLRFKNHWNVEFRAYNDGIAYRVIYSGKKALQIAEE